MNSDWWYYALKTAAMLLTGFYGIYATFSDFRVERDGRKVISRRGRIGLGLFLVSLTCSIAVDQTKDQLDARDAVRRLQREHAQDSVAQARTLEISTRLNATAIAQTKALELIDRSVATASRLDTSLRRSTHALLTEADSQLRAIDRLRSPVEEVDLSSVEFVLDTSTTSFKEFRSLVKQQGSASEDTAKSAFAILRESDPPDVSVSIYTRTTTTTAEGRKLECGIVGTAIVEWRVALPFDRMQRTEIYGPPIEIQTVRPLASQRVLPRSIPEDELVGGCIVIAFGPRGRRSPAEQRRDMILRQLSVGSGGLTVNGKRTLSLSSSTPQQKGASTSWPLWIGEPR